MIFDKSKKVFPIITAVIGVLITAAVFVLRLNLAAVVAVAYMCIMSALILLGLIFKKKLYLWNVIGYGSAGLGIILYYIFFGADAGFGAFTGGLTETSGGITISMGFALLLSVFFKSKEK